LVGRGLGPELALVPGRLLRAGGTGVAADLRLVAVEVEARRAVVRRDLRVELGVLRLEVGEVDDVGDRAQLDLVAAVAAPDPEAVLDDRAAGLEAVVVHEVDLVTLRERRLRRRVARSGTPRAGSGQLGVVEAQALLLGQDAEGAVTVRLVAGARRPPLHWAA